VTITGVGLSLVISQAVPTFPSQMPMLETTMKALAAGDRDRFLAAEADARRSVELPPFGRLAALVVSAGEADSADFAARALSRAAPSGRHRRRFLVKTGREVNLQAVLRDWLSRVRVQGSVRVQVDIDPYSFL
jgi:primosomal protein N' (replication factor Y) (superfamily II helicase)